MELLKYSNRYKNIPFLEKEDFIERMIADIKFTTGIDYQDILAMISEKQIYLMKEDKSCSGEPEKRNEILASGSYNEISLLRQVKYQKEGSVCHILFPERKTYLIGENNFHSIVEIFQKYEFDNATEILTDAAFGLLLTKKTFLYFEFLDSKKLLDKQRAFEKAVRLGDLKIVEEMYKRHYTDKCSFDTFVYVARNDNFQMLTYLFKHGYKCDGDLLFELQKRGGVPDILRDTVVRNMNIKYLDGGRFVDENLPPAKLCYKNNIYSGGLYKPISTLNEINIYLVTLIDNIKYFMEDGPKEDILKWAKKRVGDRPIDSPIYNYFYPNMEIDYSDTDEFHIYFRFSNKWYCRTIKEALDIIKIKNKKIIFTIANIDVTSAEHYSWNEAMDILEFYARQDSKIEEFLIMFGEEDIHSHGYFKLKRYLEDMVDSQAIFSLDLRINDTYQKSFETPREALNYLIERYESNDKLQECSSTECEVMKRSEYFNSLLELYGKEKLEEFAKEEFDDILKRTGLKKLQFQNLILSNRIDQINKNNFQEIITVLHQYYFNNIDEIIEKLNYNRTTSFPEIKDNEVLSDMISNTCINKKPGQKCQCRFASSSSRFFYNFRDIESNKDYDFVNDILTRGHVSCLKYFIESYNIKSINFYDFPNRGVNYSLEIVKYLVENNLFYMHDDPELFYVPFFVGGTSELMDIFFDAKYDVTNQYLANEWYFNFLRANIKSRKFEKLLRFYGIKDEKLFELKCYWGDYFIKRNVVSIQDIFCVALWEHQDKLFEYLEEKYKPIDISDTAIAMAGNMRSFFLTIGEKTFNHLIENGYIAAEKIRL